MPDGQGMPGGFRAGCDDDKGSAMAAVLPCLQITCDGVMVYDKKLASRVSLSALQIMPDAGLLTLTAGLLAAAFNVFILLAIIVFRRL